MLQLQHNKVHTPLQDFRAHTCFTFRGVTVKGFYVLLNKEADRTLSHTSLDLGLVTYYISNS